MQWNKKVDTSDEVYILGEVTLKGTIYATEILAQLNRRKYLIRGNHDRFADQETFDKTVFALIKDYYELEYQNQRFILFHYPIEEWNHFFRGSIHLHGYQHNHSDYNVQNLEKGLRHFDVGLDANNMSPIIIDELISFFK